MRSSLWIASIVLCLSFPALVSAAPVIDAPSSWFFGSVTVGSINSQGISIGNTGNANLNVTSLSLTGDFSFPIPPPSVPFNVPPGGIVTITVRFIPTAIGPRNGSLSISSNDPITPVKTVSLSGTGLGGQVSVSPTNLDYGFVNLLASSDRSLTVGNDGNQNLSLSGITFSGSGAASFGFAGTPPSFPLNIAPGALITFTIRFTPGFAGPNSATGIVTTNDPITPTKLVPVTGYGVGPTLSTIPTSLSYGDVHIGLLGDITVQVANTGGGTLTVSALSFTGPAAGSFSLVTPPTLPFNLAGGTGINLTVRFAPGTIGAKSAQLALASNDPNSPTAVALSGRGIRPEPVIAGVRDVPNDQGGKVKLSWDASTSDTQAPTVVDHYWIFRSVPPQAAVASGERVAAIASGRIDKARFYTSRFGASTYYWELLTEVRALHVIEGYSFLAATSGDSMPTYNPLTLFMVMALDASNTTHWDSAPDSGYSVDNLAPTAPAPFTGSYFNGATHLHWGPNGENDLAGYRIYRGSSSTFVPAPSNLIGSPPDTGFADAGAAGGYYKLAAVDHHGNQSGFALLTPQGTLDVPGITALALTLLPPAPNPTSSGAELAFTLPTAGDATLAIYDGQGRRLRTLVRGSRPAGRHRVHWDGRDDHGRQAGNGVFFVRLDAAGHTRTARLAVMR